MPPTANPDLREELLRRREADQAPRRKARPGSSGDHSQLIAQMKTTAFENAEWLKEMIHTNGWPGQSFVGVDGADVAWLIAQHADHDPTFQRECLELMEDAVRIGEASQSNLAYLTDRVLLNEHAMQRYGTQFRFSEKGIEPFPLEDPQRVDELRAGVGLIPLEEYRRSFLPP